MDLDSDVRTDACVVLSDLEEFNAAIPSIAESFLEDDKQWRTGGADEEVSTNYSPATRQVQLYKLECTRPHPAIVLPPSRLQPSKKKQSTLRPEHVKQCTESLPVSLPDAVRPNYPGTDVSLEREFEALSISSAAGSQMRGYTSLPALTKEQEMMFTQDADGDTQLMIAVSQANEKATIYIISKAPNYAYLDLRNNERQTALHMVVANSMYLCATKLLEKGASLGFEDYEGHNPFHIAAFHGDVDMLSMLWQYGTRFGKQNSPSSCRKLLNTKNFEGYTCFHLAVYSGNAQVIHRTATLGADVNAKDGKSGRTALHHAVEGGNIQLVEYLLKIIQVNVNETTYSGHTALDLARGRNLENIAVLLSNYGGLDCESDDDCDMELAS